MQYDVCKDNVATVHLTEIVNGKITEIHICQACANKKAQEIKSQFSISDLISGLTNLNSMSKKDILVCKICGLSYEEFKKIGKFGCGDCYAAFNEEVKYLLRKIHGSSQYKGKFPKMKMSADFSLPSRLKELRKYLDRAISLEEYEEAARIRDEIRVIELEINKQSESK